MKKIILVTLFLLGLSLLTSAQEYEYGKSIELKGLTKVFIDTELDAENRNRILEVIEKAKLENLTVVESSADAEVIIMFRGDSENVRIGRANHKRAIGKGVVATKSADGKKLRVLLSFESTQDKAGEKKPAAKFAKEFIKEYKMANGLK